MLRHGANPIAQNQSNEIPLHYAAFSGNTDNNSLSIIDAFKENKDAVNAPDKNGRTPMHWLTYGKEGLPSKHIDRRKAKRLIHLGGFLYKEDHCAITPISDLMDFIEDMEPKDRYHNSGSKSVKTIIKEKRQALMKFLISCTREREGWLDEKEVYSDRMVELFQRLEHTPVMRYIKNPDFTTLPFFKMRFIKKTHSEAWGVLIKAQQVLLERLRALPAELRTLVLLEVLIPWIHEVQDTNIPNIASAETFRHLKQLVNFYGKQEQPCDANNTVKARPNP